MQLCLSFNICDQVWQNLSYCAKYTHPYNGNYCLFYVCYTNSVNLLNSVGFSAYMMMFVLKYYVQKKSY